jgi:DNA-directed RNA polymerase specialized sigma24 family protein
MKREQTNIPEEGMLRKLAWSFYLSTGIDFEELLSEAFLRYYEAIATRCDCKESKFSTYVFCHVSNALITFCQNELRHSGTYQSWNKLFRRVEGKSGGMVEILHNGITYIEAWFEWEGCFSEKAGHIVDRLIEGAWDIDYSQPPKMIRGQITNLLRKEGWKWQDVWDAMAEIKQVVAVTV